MLQKVFSEAVSDELHVELGVRIASETSIEEVILFRECLVAESSADVGYVCLAYIIACLAWKEVVGA